MQITRLLLNFRGLFLAVLFLTFQSTNANAGLFDWLKSINEKTTINTTVSNSFDDCTLEENHSNSFLFATCSGNATSVVSQSGVNNPSNAIGVANGFGAQLYDQGDQLILDLTETIDPGENYVIRWRRDPGTSSTPNITVQESDDGVSWNTAVGSPFSFNSTSYFDQTITTSVNTRYLRFVTNNVYNVDLDAITFTNISCNSGGSNPTYTCCTDNLLTDGDFESAFAKDEKFPNSSVTTINNSNTTTSSQWGFADGSNSDGMILIDEPSKASDGDQFVYIKTFSSNSTYNRCIGNSIDQVSSVDFDCSGEEYTNGLRYVMSFDWVPFNQDFPNGGGSAGVTTPRFEHDFPALTTLYDSNGNDVSLNSSPTGNTTGYFPAVAWDDISTSWERIHGVTPAMTAEDPEYLYISHADDGTAGVLFDNVTFKLLTFSDARVADISCGTSNDKITFTLNPNADVGGVPNIKYDVSAPSGFTVSPSQGTYGTATSFTLTTVTDGNFRDETPFTVSVTVTDEINTECSAEAIIINPYPCIGTIGNRVWIDENADGIQDAGEPGISGVTVNLKQGGSIISTTITDGNGGYVFKNIDAETYTVEIDNSTLPSGLILIYDEDNGTSSPDGQASASISKEDEYVSLDFGYNYISKSNTDAPSSMSATGALGNRIWNDADADGIQDPGESGIEGVAVILLTDTDLDGIYENTGTSTITDKRGNYIFRNLVPAAYMVQVETAGLTGYNTTPTKDPDNDGNNFMEPVIIAPGDLWLEGDFGYTTIADPADIGSRVYIDINGNGSYDIGEQGIDGVSVVLILDDNKDGDWDTGEEVIATMYTKNDGRYLFPDLPDDDYIVHISDTDNLLHQYDNTGDPDGGNNEYSQVLINGSDELTENFGYAPKGHTSNKGFIGDFIFLDQNGNGSYNTGEPGIEGVTVYLLDDTNDALLKRTFTDENGKYFFGNLDDGDYRVQVVSASLPTDLTISDDPNNSAPADNESGTITINSGSNDLSQDFGYEANTPRIINGTVWEDLNAEGTLDGTEGNRFENVTVVLIDSNGKNIASTTTDEFGNYSFTGIPAAAYTVEITDNQDILFGYWHSEGTDSESDPILVDVTSNDATGIDFGYYNQSAAVGNLVWLDYNGDGVQSINEPGLEGAKISLLIDYNNDSNTDVTAVVQAGLTGDYGFRHLLLDEDYQGDGVGTEPSFEITVQEPNAAFSSSLTYQGGNTTNDSDDHSGTTVQPIQGKNDIDKNNNTDSQASFDFAYEFDCTTPITEYAVTSDASDAGSTITTSHVLGTSQGKLVHVDQVNQQHGTIRSYTYCEHNGWRYYFNPLEPDEYLFALRMNSQGGTTYNTTEIEYIEIRLDDTPSDRYSPTDAEFATFAMARDWHIKTVGDVALTEPIDIRFYFPEGEFQQMLDAAINQAVNVWGVNPPSVDSVQWFQKEVFDINSDIDKEGTNFDAHENTGLQNTATNASGINTEDTYSNGGQLIGNDKNHIQFNGITNFGGGTAQITILASLLPVELSSFEGVVEGCNIRLNWTSASEEDFSHYEIERSTTGNFYEKLETVNAQGGTFSASYQYTDDKTGENNYYRLKMIDNDGSFRYSNVINLKSNCDVIESVLLYPNPVGDQNISIKIKSRSEVAETMKVVDLLGREVYTVVLNLNEGFNSLQYNASDLQNGVYIIKVGQRTKKKFTKITKN